MRSSAAQPIDTSDEVELLYGSENASMALSAGREHGATGGTKMKTSQTRRYDQQAIASVATELAALDKMTVGDLVTKYREVFGEPTRSRNKDYLRKKVAWRIQELAEGGLSDRAVARIHELGADAPARWRKLPPKPTSPAATRDPRLPDPGEVIRREFQGTAHEVTVLEDGFVYQGRSYPTLSKIAREITGTNWNGYLFFGLQRRGKNAAEEATCG